MHPKVFSIPMSRLEELIEEAQVDCYDVYEQHSGLANSLIENLIFPFEASVIGEKIQVVDCDDDGQNVYAICLREGRKFVINIDSLEFSKPLPEGYEWIEAYLFWRSQL